MDSHRLVLPEHLNDQGSLFGGYLLKWLDECAYITANLDFPGHRFVTIALDNVEFRHPIACGQVLRFSIHQHHWRNTSVEYLVEVFGEKAPAADKGVLFATKIVFVNLNEDGAKTKIARG